MNFILNSPSFNPRGLDALKAEFSALDLGIKDFGHNVRWLLHLSVPSILEEHHLLRLQLEYPVKSDGIEGLHLILFDALSLCGEFGPRQFLDSVYLIPAITEQE
jgi:hypothetical protein